MGKVAKSKYTRRKKRKRSFSTSYKEEHVTNSQLRSRTSTLILSVHILQCRHKGVRGSKITITELITSNY